MPVVMLSQWLWASYSAGRRMGVTGQSHPVAEGLKKPPTGLGAYRIGRFSPSMTVYGRFAQFQRSGAWSAHTS